MRPFQRWEVNRCPAANVYNADMDRSDQIYDHWLVTRCQDGDAGALDELMTRWQERLWRHAVRLTGNTETAWDVLQECLIVISRKIGKLEDPGSFSAWAYRIATNHCHDHFRRQQRLRISMEAYVEQQLAQATPIPEGLHFLDLKDALRRLPGTQQTLVSLRYEEGFSVVEIAGILGIQEGTVKSRLHTARQRLRALLEEQTHELE